MKREEAITIHISKEVYQQILFNAEQERRKPAELVALWVEDVAIVETQKKTDKGTTWSRPTFARW